MLNAQLRIELLTYHVPCEVQQEKLAKQCDAIINQATVPENYQRVLRIC